MAASWNRNKKWPKEVKQKISKTMKSNHRMHTWSEDELKRRS